MPNKNLSSLARRVLRDLIDIVIPRSEDFYLPMEDEIVDFIDNFTSYFATHLRKGFPLGLYAFEFLPILMIGKFSRFTSLKMEEKERYVATWVHSKVPMFREMIKGIKGLVAAAFYDDPRVMAHIGYFIEDHIEQVNRTPHVPAEKTVPLGDNTKKKAPAKKRSASRAKSATAEGGAR